MTNTVTFDKQKFRQAVRAMAEATFNEFAYFAQSFIVEEKRDYPRDTDRRYGVGMTGKWASSPRDVVDSGKLRNSYSQQFTYSPTMCKLLLEWSANHAQIVYGGTSTIPPYPWVLLAMREFDWLRTFANKWKAIDGKGAKRTVKSPFIPVGEVLPESFFLSVTIDELQDVADD